mgnify:CR=1 FL=1
MADILLTLAALLLCAATLLPLLRHDAWWVRAGDFPRMQLATLLTLLLAAQAILYRGESWQLALMLPVAGCLGLQLWWILPYTPLWRHEVRRARGDGCDIRIMTANVLTPNRNADGLLALVAQCRPDILVTLETDAWWQVRLDALEPAYPHTIKCALDNLYGMHVYSRLPLEQAEISFLVEHDIPSMHALARLDDGTGVRMHFLHPAPPSPTENETSGERDAELLMVARSVADCADPVIVTGDLNDVAWSHTTRLFRRISGLLDPRVGRGPFNSYNAHHWFVRWPLDHIFHSSHFTLAEIRRLPAYGSDHFAMLIALRHTPAAAPAQDGLEADGEDHAEARERIAEQGVHDSAVPEPRG